MSLSKRLGEAVLFGPDGLESVVEETAEAPRVAKRASRSVTRPGGFDLRDRLGVTGEGVGDTGEDWCGHQKYQVSGIKYQSETDVSWVRTNGAASPLDT